MGEKFIVSLMSRLMMRKKELGAEELEARVNILVIKLLVFI